jgi:hypothetical protein
VHGLIDIRIEDDLSNPIPVSQVNEYDATVIPSTEHPTHENNFFPDIPQSKLTACMGSTHVSDFISQRLALLSALTPHMAFNIF